MQRQALGVSSRGPRSLSLSPILRRNEPALRSRAALLPPCVPALLGVPLRPGPAVHVAVLPVRGVGCPPSPHPSIAHTPFRFLLRWTKGCFSAGGDGIKGEFIMIFQAFFGIYSALNVATPSHSGSLSATPSHSVQHQQGSEGRECGWRAAIVRHLPFHPGLCLARCFGVTEGFGGGRETVPCRIVGCNDL
jgi:hypothetical protein